MKSLTVVVNIYEDFQIQKTFSNQKLKFLNKNYFKILKPKKYFEISNLEYQKIN